MATYSYVSTMPGLSDVVEGVSFTANVPINYSTDQISLNKHVPARLNRFVDGVLSINDLVTPVVVTNQERYERQTEIGLTAAQVLAMQGLLSPNSKYMYGALVANQLPNNTLTDTVATEQQMAVATIPGGLFSPTARLEVNLTGQCTGAGASKSVGFKAGPASGNMASATIFGGTGGLTAQYVGSKALIWGNGSLGTQRASPSGPVNWAAANTSPIVSLAIDTELDWNIYVYFTAGTTGGTNSFMLRSFWAQWVG